MNNHKNLKYILLYLIPIIAFSCKNEPQFTITGEIQGAKDTILYLEKRDLNNIVLIDSVKVASDGKFKVQAAAPLYPELYILRLGNQAINLGVDSTETINIKVQSVDKFATDYSVEGSEESSKIKDISLKNYAVAQEITSLTQKLNEKTITTEKFTDKAMEAINDFKRLTTDIIVKRPGSISAYYALFQKIDGNLLFDPYDKRESKLYGAVATQWDQHYKESPRAKHLYKFTLGAMRAQREIQEQNNLLKDLSLKEKTDLLIINLPNVQNKLVPIASLKGKVIVLDFTSYVAQFSPEHNAMLNKAYEKYKSNIEIYQVSFDTDQHFWKNAAINIPWICVREEQGLESTLIRTYNIQDLPTTYLIDKNGDITKRMLPNDNLEAEIAKLL